MKRSPLRRYGRRAQREKEALDAFREEVLRRAAGHCERCGFSGPLDAHHTRRRWKTGGKHDPEFGAALCRTWGGREGCHEKIHRGSSGAKDFEGWFD